MKYPRLHSRAAKPVGSVTIVRDGNKPRVRRIKVRMDGPRSGRWVDFARWWWETNRGPVPLGKRVAHLDGDTLNDDPANLALLDPGDVVFLAHDRDPEMSRQNYQKLREATVQMNRLRAESHRLRHWLPTRWYAVDLKARTILNAPRRQEWQVFADAGAACSAATWRTCRQASLGYPGQSLAGACILTVLIDQGSLTVDELRAAVRSFRAERQWGDGLESRDTVPSAVSLLGELVIHRFLGGRRRYQVSVAGMQARQGACGVVAIRGTSLADEAFAGFTKLMPGVAGEVAA